MGCWHPGAFASKETNNKQLIKNRIIFNYVLEFYLYVIWWIAIIAYL